MNLTITYISSSTANVQRRHLGSILLLVVIVTIVVVFIVTVSTEALRWVALVIIVHTGWVIVCNKNKTKHKNVY